MVTGIFKAEACFKVKNNKFYGDYTTTEVDTRTIVNEKYEGLVPPQNGIKLTVSTYDHDKVTFTIGKYYFTGEYKDEHNKNTLYTLGFGYKGHMYEITVNVKGELVSFDEWLSFGDFDDGNEPDSHYTKKSKNISWELVDL
jgi:hypothetical protein